MSHKLEERQIEVLYAIAEASGSSHKLEERQIEVLYAIAEASG